MTIRLRGPARAVSPRVALVLGLLACVLVGLPQEPRAAAAQVTTTSQGAQIPDTEGTVTVEEDDAVAADAEADEETEREVRRAVIVLAVIAGVALVLTGAFWYHTIPSRRIIAARRERARERARAVGRPGDGPVDVVGPEATEPAEKSTS